MALTDLKIRSAKPAAKPTKLADGLGLYMLLQPTGAKLWRLKYRIAGKEKKLSLGIYPDVSLRDARERRDQARAQLAAGIDPGNEKKRLAAERAENERQSFEAVANEYLADVEKGRASVTIKKSRWLLSLMLPDLGSRPISEIRSSDLLKVLKVVEHRGHLETARRMRSLAGRIFRFAMVTDRAIADPSVALRGQLATREHRHHSAILDETGVGALMRAIDSFSGQPLTQLALKLTPHVFVRPGELRRAEWCEFDLERAIWTIPATKMKMRSPHYVPLSRQALEIVRAAQALSGHQTYVFSSLYPGNRPMSENTINAALRRLGYQSDEMTAHGFRATASTLLNESNLWNPDAIERALAHKDTNKIRAAYHRGGHWEERVKMAQWWSDKLDLIKA